MGQQSKKDYLQQAKERRRQIAEEEAAKRSRQNKIVIGVVCVSVVLLAAIIAVFIITNQPRKAPKMQDIDFSQLENPSEYQVTQMQTDLVRLTVSYTSQTEGEKQGDIYLRLYPDVAPETVANFKSLVASGFYDGTVFHRVYPGFMIQGGSGSVETATIKGEFTSNGFENNLEHVRGVLSMARSNSPDSASSSFFIMLEESSSLNKNYASFGYVVSGMETVDEIAKIKLGYNNSSIDGETPTSPIYPVTIKSAVFVTEAID